MAQASVTFNLGAETVTVVLPIDLPAGGVPLSGDVSGTFGDCFVAGDLNLTGNLFIEGLMTGIDTFHIQGNGFTVFFQNGGQADLHGKFKAAWGPWGTDTTGWMAGDRLGVAPTKLNIFVPSELVWSNWSMARPVNSPNVTLVDGTIAKPEVVNLGQSIVIENLARGFHFHDSAGIQSLSDVKFLNCGTAGVLGNYPAHFHLLGNNSRGSVLTRVVVEGGKNHAFVPHGSHGITFKDCVAYNTAGPAYWWDPPLNNNQPDPNESHDIFYDHPLALWVTGTDNRLDGFTLGRGTGNKCINAVAAAVQGGTQASGFEWPELGTGVWEFTDCVAHNNKALGIFGWQNTTFDHIIEDFTAYRNGRAGILHGAYLNFYQYRNIKLTQNGQNGEWAFMAHALSSNLGSIPDKNLIIEDVLTDGRLLVSSHQQFSARPGYFRRGAFTGVTYNEVNAGQYSYWVYEDFGFVPSDFTLTLIQPQSLIEIKEGGVLTHRWASGSWG